MLSEAAIQKIVRKYGAPLYIYDKQQLERRLEEIISIPYGPAKIFAATMANSSPALLKLYKNYGLGVFVNSIKHMALCKRAGFRGENIMWTSTGMTKHQMQAAISEGTMLNLDSVSQLELYGSLHRGGRVGLRVNIGDMPDNETYAGVFVGKKSRIGILPSEVKEVKRVIKKHTLSIIGLHVYLGTDISRVSHFKLGIHLLSRFISCFEDLEYIDLGGGFALPEGKGFDFKEYGTTITNLMVGVSEEYKKRFTLILEPGRVLAGDAGYFVTRVTDVKLRHDFKYIFVEGSSAIFPRPLLYPQLPNSPHYVLGKDRCQKMTNVNICGSTTYSRDFLARASNRVPKNIAIGDIVVFGNAGSYAYSSRTDFLGIEIPMQVLVNEQSSEVISKGERY